MAMKMKKLHKLTGVVLAAMLAVTAAAVPASATDEVKSALSEGSSDLKSGGTASACTLSSDGFTAGAETGAGTALSSEPETESVFNENGNVGVEYADGEAIVVMKDNRKVSSINGAFTVKKTFSHETDGKTTKNFAVVSSDKMTTPEMIKALKSNPDVKSAFPNYIKHISSVTNDPYSSLQWQLDNTGQNGGIVGLDAAPEKLWRKSASAGGECVVAVIDTGINYNHPDLKNVLWKNTYRDLPGYGSCGYDLTGHTSEGPWDEQGHGTNVAGLIAESADNGIGTSGINKRGVKIMALKIGGVEGSSSISTAAELEAYEYVLKAVKLGVNVKVINGSFCGFNNMDAKAFYDEKYDELGKAGVIVCVAAGNNSLDVDRVYNLEDDYGNVEPGMILPAATDSKYAITVAASNESDRLVSFSNYGKKTVDIAAPGVAMFAAYNTDVFNPVLYDSSKINRLCASYQSFNSGSADNLIIGNSCTASYVGGFGSGGYSLKITVPEASHYYGTIKFPFNVSSLSDTYYLSMDLGKYSDNTKIWIGNLPYETVQNGIRVGDLISGQYVAGFSTGGYSNYYEHLCIDLSQYTVTDSSVYDNTKRVFIFIIDSPTDNISCCIDNLAISKGNLDPSEFGKYEYIQGTSQACPTVAGAAALIYNCDTKLKPTEIINLIKNYGRKSGDMSGKIETGSVLSLDKAADHVGSPSSSSNLKGDVDGNGEVNAKDRIILTRYLSKWSGYRTVNERNSDVNGDGKIDAKDRIRLTRHLARWAGYGTL